MAKVNCLFHCEVLETQVPIDERRLTSPVDKNREAKRVAFQFLDTLCNTQREQDLSAHLASACNVDRVICLELSPSEKAILFIIVKFSWSGVRPQLRGTFEGDWLEKSVECISKEKRADKFVLSTPCAKYLRAMCVVSHSGLLTMYLYDENKEEMYHNAESLQRFESLCNDRCFRAADSCGRDDTNEDENNKAAQSLMKLFSDLEVSVSLHTKHRYSDI
uniref:Uncharacterized protein n=1 Tax=Spumella elongata TaxID=89044 RepID=A0A7S3HG82_9STRA